MEAKIIVTEDRVKQTMIYSSVGPTNTTFYHWSILALAALALVVSVYSMVRKSENSVN